MNIARYMLPGLMVLTLSMTLPSAGFAEPPAEQTLKYKVDFRGHSAGELETIIERTEDGYIVKSVSHLSLIAKAFLSNETAETVFRYVDDELVLQSGSEYVTKSGKEIRSFEIDHEAGQILFSDGDPLAMEPGVRLEVDNFPLALMANGIDKAAGTKFYAVSTKRARLYQTEEPTREKVKVPAGEFDAILVQHTLPGDPTRIFKIWMQDGPQPIPLRVETGREGKLTVMELLP